MKNKPKQKRKKQEKVPTREMLAQLLQHQVDVVNEVIENFQVLKEIAAHRMEMNFTLGAPLVKRVAKIEKHLSKFAHEFEIQNNVITEQVHKHIEEGSVADAPLKAFKMAFGTPDPSSN